MPLGSAQSGQAMWRLGASLRPLERLPSRRWPAIGAVRHIRAGFFNDDADYIDPDAPLLADRVGMRWRYMDDPALRAPLLERNNVGMGMLVLNRAKGLDLPLINDLYVRLRNFEVNSFKRFVGLTAAEPGPFCVGLDPQELLLAATCYQRRGRLPRFSKALLWHHQELAHLVSDYRKPLVCQISGRAENGGAALAGLSNFCGAHRDSEVVVDACFMGLVPTGGMCAVLARLDWHLGPFMALTGWPLRGADLVYAGLAEHWVAPEALPFLELTAEKQLEVTEADARALLDEHSLPLPDPFQGEEEDSIRVKLLPEIDRAFRLPTIHDIVTQLKALKIAADPDVQRFAEQCLERMARASPLALHVTLDLIAKAKNLSKSRTTIAEEVLHDELVAVQRLLCSRDALVGLHARCLGREVSPGEWTEVRDGEAKEAIKQVMGEPTEGMLASFTVHERSDISLSQHPRLRRYHPEYDAATGLDHDPAWMSEEVERWRPTLFADERQKTIHELLGGRDPAEYGQARYVRVDSATM